MPLRKPSSIFGIFWLLFGLLHATPTPAEAQHGLSSTDEHNPRSDHAEKRGATSAAWPPADVAEISIQDPAFPGFTFNMTYYHNTTCESTPFRNWLFTNQSVLNATYKDVLDDMQPLWEAEDPTGRMNFDIQTEQLAMDLWYYVNTTLALLNIEDLPPNSGGILASSGPGSSPRRRAVPSASDAAPVENGGTPFAAVSGNRPAPAEIQPADQQHNEPHVTAPAGLEPHGTSVAAQEPDRVRTYVDTIWDWAIIIFGGLGGMVITWALSSAALHIKKLHDRPDLVNLFGAFGINVGIITGVVIGQIQRARERKAEKIKSAAESLSFRTGITSLQNEIVNLRGQLVDLARERGDTVPTVMVQEALNTVVKEPLQSLKTNSRKLAKATKRKAKGSWDDLTSSGKASLNSGESFSSGPQELRENSAPGNVENANIELSPLKDPARLRRVRTDPQCALPNSAYGTLDTIIDVGSSEENEITPSPSSASEDQGIVGWSPF